MFQKCPCHKHFCAIDFFNRDRADAKFSLTSGAQTRLQDAPAAMTHHRKIFFENLLAQALRKVDFDANRANRCKVIRNRRTENGRQRTEKGR